MKRLVWLFAPAALLFSCGGEETTETVEEVVEEVVDPANKDVDAEITAYLDEKGWTGERQESGLYIVTDSAGVDEARPAATDSVTIFYQGYLLDGTQFDGTGDAPATFLLTDLIMGWQEGIPHFGRGGSGKLLIPSALGYGDRDMGDIPAYSTLMFEIQVVDFKSNEVAQ